MPVLPVAGDVPRGARYGGAATRASRRPPRPPPPPARAGPRGETVAALGRLRAEGRSGEAHALLCEAAARPAPWLPLLAAELHRAGLDADWATLLWEVASQPALRLAAAAGALAAAGRTEDSRQLLRQGVARPADDIAAAVLALEDEGRNPEAGLYWPPSYRCTPPRTRPASPTGIRAASCRNCSTPHARPMSAAHERDLVHALRVAGHLGG